MHSETTAHHSTFINAISIEIRFRPATVSCRETLTVSYRREASLRRSEIFGSNLGKRSDDELHLASSSCCDLKTNIDSRLPSKVDV